MTAQHPKPVTPGTVAGVAIGLWLGVIAWGWWTLLAAGGAVAVLLWLRPGWRHRVAEGLIATARIAGDIILGRPRGTPAGTDGATAGTAGPATAGKPGRIAEEAPARPGAADRKPKPSPSRVEEVPADVAELRTAIDEVFVMFGVGARVSAWTRGPAVTRLEVTIDPGVKVSAVTALVPNIAYAAGASPRVEAPIPGKSAIGLELPRAKRDTVTLASALAVPAMAGPGHPLRIVAGVSLDGRYVTADLDQLPHLLIAGTTGSGKSGALNSILCTLLTRAIPEQVRLLLIDPKRVELAAYEGVAHLLRPIITTPSEAVQALEWVVAEMDRRYDLLAAAGVRNIGAYNQRPGAQTLPRLVVVVDELADLMLTAKGQVEAMIVRVAQLARAAGIHLVLATQRPSVDVVTGLIKANMPSRWSFAVASQTDSRTILDTGGAEQLLGSGDSLWLPMGAPTPIRLQGVWVDEADITATVEHARSTAGDAYPDVDLDGPGSRGPVVSDQLRHAAQLVTDTGQASVGLLKRRMRLGHTRAAQLIDELELHGIVGPAAGHASRTVLITPGELAWKLADIEGSPPE